MKPFVLLAALFSVTVVPLSASIQSSRLALALTEQTSRFGWTLIHSTWQLAAIALIARVLSGLLSNQPADRRYRVFVTIFAFMFIVPIYTWNTLESAPRSKAFEPAISNTTNIHVSAETDSIRDRSVTKSVADPATPQEKHEDLGSASSDKESMPVSSIVSGSFLHKSFRQLQELLEPYLQSIVLFWILGAALFSCRPIIGFWSQWQLRRSGLTAVSNSIHERLQNLARQIGLNSAIRVAESARVGVPVVIGCFRPMILLPASFLSGLTTSQLDALLTHELAHIKRYDCLINAIQIMAETLFFFHPCVWWLSNLIRVEREHCCDDIALAALGDRVSYSRMLLMVAELRANASDTVLAASGGNLLQRVRRLMSDNTANSGSPSGWIAGSFAVALTFAALAGLVTSSDTSADDAKNVDSPSKAAVALNETESNDANNDNESEQITGTIVTPEGKPVDGVEVLVLDQFSLPLPHHFVSDKQGEFRVPAIWRNSIRSLKLIARTDTGFGWHDFQIHAIRNVQESENQDSFSIVLLPMTHKVSGQIVNDAGQPIAGVAVIARLLIHENNLQISRIHFDSVGSSRGLNQDVESKSKPGVQQNLNARWPYLFPSTITDKEGRYELQLPENSTAVVDTHHTDWVTQRFNVKAGQTEAPQLTLGRGAKISGRVVHAVSGKPMSNIRIYAQGLRPAVGGEGAGNTDQDGRYLIGGLHAGSFNIFVYDSPDRRMIAPAFDSVQLTTNETFDADFSMQVGRRVAGQVVDQTTGEPIVGCYVGYHGPARPRSGAAIMSELSDDTGEFEFFVPPGMSHFYIAELRERGPESTTDIDIPEDEDVDDLILTAGAKMDEVDQQRRFGIFVGPPLQRKVSIDARDTSLRFVLESFCQDTGIKLQFDTDSIQVQGDPDSLKVTVSMTNARLQDALSKVLKPYDKLSYAIEGNKLFVGSKARVEERKKGKAQNLPIHFQGVVRDSRQQPIPKADVVMCTYRPNNPTKSVEVVATTRSDEQGRYSTTVPDEILQRWKPDFNVVIWARSDDFGPGIVQMAGAGQIFENEKTRSKLNLQPSYLLEIGLVDHEKKPLEGRVLKFQVDGHDVPASLLKQIAPEEFRGQLPIRVMPRNFEGGSHQPRALTVETASHGVMTFMWNLQSSEISDTGALNGHSKITLVASPLARVTGRLISPADSVGSASLAGLGLEFESYRGESSQKTPWCWGHVNTKTDVGGRFDFRIPTGKIMKIRADSPANTHWKVLVPNRPHIELAVDHTTTIDVPFVTTRELKGIVRRPNGDGVPDIEFLFSHGDLSRKDLGAQYSNPNARLTQTEAAYSNESVVTDSTGRFSMRVIPGRVNVSMQVGAGSNIGITTIWPQSERFSELQSDNTLSIPASGNPFELPPVELTRYQGTVIDEQNQPVQGLVMVRSEAGMGGMTNSDTVGHFSLDVIGKPIEWHTTPHDELGDFGFPGKEPAKTAVKSESPLVLQFTKH